MLPADAIVQQVDGENTSLQSAYENLAGFLGHEVTNRPEVIFNFSHTPLSARLAALMNGRAYRGLHADGNAHLACSGDWLTYLLGVIDNKSLNPINLAEIYARSIESAAPIPGLSLNISPDDERQCDTLLSSFTNVHHNRMVVLHPGASNGNRCWPAHQFGKLAEALSVRGYSVLISGSRPERDACEQVMRLSGNTALNLCGLTEIGSLAALLSRSIGVVAGDTGALHLAAAVGTPSVGIFIGPASAKDTGPFAAGHRIIAPDLPGTPCEYRQECGVCGCASRIPMHQVLALFMSVMNNDEPLRSQFDGVRVYKTVVSNSGEYRAVLLNSPRYNSDQDWIAFYREFWKHLLTSRSDNGKRTDLFSCPASPRAIHLVRESESALHRLWLGSQDEINITALPQKTLELLSDAVDQVSGLESGLAPFVKFIHRRQLLAPAASWQSFLAHTERSLVLLHRGLRALEGHLPAQCTHSTHARSIA